MSNENSRIKPANKDYKKDVKYTVELSDYMLRVLGVWPSFERRTLAGATLKVALIISCYALSCFFVVPSILHLVQIESNPHAKLKKLPLIFYNVMSIAKYSGLLLREGQIKVCLRHVRQDWMNVTSERYQATMREKAKMGRRLILICGVLMYSSGCFNRVFLPLSRGTIVTDKNVTIRPLPCASYYVLFDEQISPVYEIVFTLQCVSGLVTYSITTAICGLAALFVMHACGQLEILVSLMRGIVERNGDYDFQNTDKQLAITVEHQIRVRSFMQMVENTMQQICLLELMGCTLTMCFFGYCLITDWGNHNASGICTYFIGLLSITSHIFMFCFVGEQLTLQAEKVALTSCVLEWYRLPDKKARSIILVMAMSNCPIKITAGNVVELSLQTFGQVIRTAAAYCNMLRTVTY